LEKKFRPEVYQDFQAETIADFESGKGKLRYETFMVNKCAKSFSLISVELKTKVSEVSFVFTIRTDVTRFMEALWRSRVICQM
jgi:hypothetical protein